MSNSITTITQDDIGFLWLGTEYGLVRFDGYNYLSFYANEDNTNSIPSNIIRRIIKTKKGDIWVGTDRGIAYVDLPNGKIIRPDFSNQYNHLSINTICEDTEGNLWLGTNEGVKVISPLLKKSKSISIKLNEQQLFNVNFIDVDNNGNIWIGSNFGICSIKKIPSETLFTSKRINGKIWLNKNNKNRLTYFTVDQSNKLWINLNEESYYYTIKPDGTLADKTNINANIDGKCILISSDNRVLIGLRWNGITEIGKEMDLLKPISHSWMDSKSNTDLSNMINVLFEDRDGNIWAGTKAGLFVNRKSTSVAFHNIKADEQNAYKLSHNSISSIVQTKDETIWLGTSNGLNQLTLQNGLIPNKPVFQHFDPAQIQRGNPSADITVQCLIEDINRQLWVGTKQGIIFFDPQKKSFYNKETIERFLNQKNIALTKTFYRDTQNNIWIGFTFGGVVFYSAEKDECTQLEGFTNSDVWAIAKDHSGNMWIGTHNGLFRFNSNLKIGQIDHNTNEYKHETDNRHTIPANWVTSIQIGTNGDVWIGTSEGLCKYNPANDTFDRIDLAVGNHPPYICGITEDLKGRIWISTTSGVFRKEGQNNIEYFELSGGSFSSINYTFGHCLTEKGEVLLGGTSGLIYFRPDEIIPDSSKQSIYFSQLLIPNRISNIKNININDLSKVTLTHNDKQFSISFSTLNYASSNRVKYSYRIKESSKEWIFLDAVNNVSFSNLPIGKYTLEVRSTTASGFWQKNPRTIQIVVLPPWWKTTWAYFIYLVLFALGLYLIFQWFKARERLLRINELNHFKLVFYTNLLHSFKGPLSLMQAPLNNLIKNHKKMGADEVEEMLAFLQRNSKRLSHMVMQLLEFRKIDRGKLSLNLSNNDIIALLKDVYESFSVLAESKQINFSFNTELKSQNLVFDFEKIETVLYNLLSNAFKFTEKGGSVSINAELSPSGNEFIFSITDTGIGIAQENQKKIFERFWQVYNDNPMLFKGTGIGLSLAKDFVEAHHGSINVQSELGKGSCFTVILKAGSDHLADIPISSDEKSQLKKAENVAHYVEIENEISVEEIDEVEETKKLPVIYVLSENNEVLNFLYVTLNKDYHVFTFKNEYKISEKITEQVPSLIISDILFQGKTLGLHFCKKIKTDIETNHIPFILLAEESNEDEKLAAYESGVDAYIEKPVDVNLLLVRIGIILKMKEDIIEKTQREIIANPQNISATSQDTKFLQDVMKVIEENMDDEHFTLDDFANYMKVSRSKLNSRMIALTQQPPIEFMRTVKLKRAAQLLKLNAYSISEISYMVGISDPRYFSTIFKKQYGVSPLQYAKQETKMKDGKQEK